MAVSAITTAVYSTPAAKPADGNAQADQLTRVVVSRTSFTRYDGSTVTTTIYSDGTTETETSEGDSVTLSTAAQKLLAA
mgnify:CR=1 FL=1